MNLHDVSEICGNCGHRYGKHMSRDDSCPAPNGMGWSTFNKFALLVPAPVLITTGVQGAPRCQRIGPLTGNQCILEEGHSTLHSFYPQPAAMEFDTMPVATSGSASSQPKMKVPALPLEVFHTKEFDADEAWKAMRDLSRGA